MKRIIVFCLIGLLCSCVSTNQNNAKVTPVQGKNIFQGDIYPVDKPIQMKIAPAQIKAQMHFVFGKPFPITIRLKTSGFDRQLRWLVEYRSEDTSDTVIRGSVITNEQGKSFEMENHFSIEGEDSDGFKEYGNCLFFISFNLFLPQFSSEPVKSGDVIYEFPDLRKYFRVFGDEDLKIEIVSSRGQAVLKGWAYENGRKVLVADIRGQSTWRDIGKSPLEIKLMTSGYSLIDPETGQIIKVNIRYAPEQQRDDFFETRYSAEIE